MDFKNLYMLLGFLECIIQFEVVHGKIASESPDNLPDSLKQWNDYGLICGYVPGKVSLANFFEMVNNSQNSTENETEMNTMNISNSLRIEDYPRSIQQIIINYETFECCLKNIVKNIRNVEESEQCLANFFQCVLKSKTEKCTTQWKFYMYLVSHDQKYTPIVVFTIIGLNIAVLFTKVVRNLQFSNSDRDPSRRYSYTLIQMEATGV